jgi:PAS domain S-box-containing protein
VETEISSATARAERALSVTVSALPAPIRILLLEDNPVDADLCVRKLKSAGLPVHVDVARSAGEFMERVPQRNYDLILTDYRLPDWNGLDAFTWLRSSGHSTPFILVTGTLGDELAIECIKAGINDYVLKENLERLPVAVARALEEQKLRVSRDEAWRNLRQSEKQYRLLFDANPHPMWVYDPGTLRFLIVNNAAVTHYGFSSEEFLSMTVRDLLPKEGRDRLPDPDENRNGTELHREFLRHRKKNGAIIEVEISSQPILFGGVGARLILAHDITARRRAETDLRRSVAAYGSIIDHAPYGIYRVDRNGRIVMANPAFVAMLAYSTPTEVTGLDIAQDVYLDPGDRERLTSMANSDPFSAGGEVKWKRKDGTPISVRLAGRRLEDDGEIPGGYEVFVEDITETRSLQKQFEHAQKMEAVGRLAGGVAHDFNNLLMVISGYAQLLEKASNNPEKVISHAAQIRDAGAKAAGITRQLLAFSRKQVLEPTVLDLNRIISELGKMLPRLLREDVEIAMNLDPGLGAVRADRGQLEQVIMNLAVNARDAMPRGGRLTLETHNMLLDASYNYGGRKEVPPGLYVVLSVMDTGTGMDAATQAHIFEPFFTTKEPGKGTGLGLATAYGIVKQSQGFIWVYSEVGQGTVFRIYLPRIDQVADIDQLSQQAEAAPGGTETVFLVEDEAAVRKVTKIYMESKGYKVLEAANAAEALQTFQSYDEPIHLMITDMVMPGMGGLDLARSVLKMRPSLTVVIVSGYTDRALDLESSDIGAQFLRKPFSLDTLARLVRSMMDKKHP